MKLDTDLSHWLAEFLHELATEKKKAREKDEAARSRSQQFWQWWRDYGSGMSTLVTIISLIVAALWTFTQYRDQQRQQLEQQRQQLLQQKAETERQTKTLIAQFAGELGDKTKQNSAAYALAVLAPKESIPILRQHLLESTKDDDSAFTNALVQSFITIGNAARPYILDLNRQKARESFTPANDRVLVATQSVLLEFVKTDRKSLIDDGISFAGTVVKAADLSYQVLDGLKLDRMRIDKSNFCSASMKNVSLREVSADSTEFGSVDFEKADLSGAHFRSNTLSNASLKGVLGVHAEFNNADLEHASFVDAVLTDSLFERATLYRSVLRSANLSNADFKNADLEDADFSDADLSGTQFSVGSYDKPRPTGNGAYVLNANFDRAKNMSPETRTYLCKWGAINVPGGCDDVKKEKLALKIGRSGGSGGCF
jgi:uncharacterized protein YjbI with pentapeptide repeats